MSLFHNGLTCYVMPEVHRKMTCLAKRHNREVGGFGVTIPKNNFCVTECDLVPQIVTQGSIEFDDDAIDDYLQRKAGIINGEMPDDPADPQTFGHIWIHTQPGGNTQPSTDDWETFEEILTNHRAQYDVLNSLNQEAPTPWAVMLIISENGPMSASVGMLFAGHFCFFEIPVEVAGDPNETDDWEKEYKANCKEREYDNRGGRDPRSPIIIHQNTALGTCEICAFKNCMAKATRRVTLEKESYAGQQFADVTRWFCEQHHLTGVNQLRAKRDKEAAKDLKRGSGRQKAQKKKGNGSVSQQSETTSSPLLNTPAPF